MPSHKQKILLQIRMKGLGLFFASDPLKIAGKGDDRAFFSGNISFIFLKAPRFFLCAESW
ncbi:hypothetical protein UZ35_03765 [Heyndrickxia coagulans]|jgi:hypothetical protein|uniref:Uncharacterized protein n=1 Tax=Heyndrickxia coagulans TaxID=1398 RepID=A0A0C5C1X9_HEYCO|nr:hypothetical protein SB48_HM08orf02341 [Heyndrickxia coagulans]KGT39971.1 hypothetical protein P421_02675 [Heyndrickxia coagulans P38]APB36696.1 hypothetical protein BIZ35_07460 [Heyndrickxia coagulans]ATW82632.1 hypothetical protein CIW84_06490 [Heyndrickxia coagulans]KGB28905.1 hypothetical protein IE89_14435 [Heyndrickxia coagulans]